MRSVSYSRTRLLTHVRTHTGLCKYLLYEVPMKPEVASAIAICALVFYAASFFVFDVFVVNEPSRWIYTSYAALAAGSLM